MIGRFEVVYVAVEQIDDLVEHIIGAVQAAERRVTAGCVRLLERLGEQRLQFGPLKEFDELFSLVNQPEQRIQAQSVLKPVERQALDSVGRLSCLVHDGRQDGG